jgi:hypothetical protein
MSQLEYLVALISIIVGLGLTDLAQSVRELIRPGYAVKWDGLPLAWSAFVFLFTILLWWNGFSVLESASSAGEAGPRFLSYLLLFFLLYLCCAFALPDPDWETSVAGSGDGSEPAVDLEAFYFSAGHRRWFFGLLTGLFVALWVDNQDLLRVGKHAGPSGVGPGDRGAGHGLGGADGHGPALGTLDSGSDDTRPDRVAGGPTNSLLSGREQRVFPTPTRPGGPAGAGPQIRSKPPSCTS